MLKSFLIPIFSLASSCVTQGQNLVPNPSFEENKKLTCATIQDHYSSAGRDGRLAFDSILYYWIAPTTLWPEVFNTIVDKTCETNPWKYGYGPSPKDGYFMTQIKLIVDHSYPLSGHALRSYVQSPLKEILKAGHRYLGGGYQAFFVGDYACNNLGMLYTNQPIGLDTPFVLSYHPQINQEEVNKDPFVWKKFFGCFTATGDEQYLTLGNFYDDEHTKIALTLKEYDRGVDYSKYFIDSVFTEEIEEPFIPNVITPNSDQKNDKFKIENLHFGWWSLDIYNRWGQSVYHSSDYRNTWNGSDFSPGVYYYELRHRCPEISYKGPLTIIR